ncbi:hypothetical protein Tco_0983299 [Tanacetum coccineum]
MTQDIGAHAAVHIFNRISFAIAKGAWYLDDDTIIGDTMVVGKVLELIMDDGPRCGLHLNVDKIEVFGQRNYSMKQVILRVAKTIMLMDTIVKIDDPECELFLLRACVGLVWSDRLSNEDLPPPFIIWGLGDYSSRYRIYQKGQKRSKNGQIRAQDWKSMRN